MSRPILPDTMEYVFVDDDDDPKHHRCTLATTTEGSSTRLYVDSKTQCIGYSPAADLTVTEVTHGPYDTLDECVAVYLTLERIRWHS